MSSGCIVAIRPRRKATAENTAAPTAVSIFLPKGKPVHLLLATAEEELDFINGRFPTTYRKAVKTDKLADFQERHLKTKKWDGPPDQILHNGQVVTHVPTAYQGIQSGDIVLLLKGGHGDRMAFAMATPKLEVAVLRVTAQAVIEWQGSSPTQEKEEHAVPQALYELYRTKPELFYVTDQPGREEILLNLQYRMWVEAQKARIALETQVLQNAEGALFLTEGLFSEGSMDERMRDIKAQHPGLNALIAEEDRLEKELVKAVSNHRVWKKILVNVKGIGPLIAARMIVGIGDIRRFPRASMLAAYAGVHLLPDGSFPRRKRGVAANWNPVLRQSLWLFQDQCNRQAESEWGKKLREYKVTFTQKYPDDSKWKIHRRACWRISTQFIEWLHQEWTELDGAAFLKPEPDLLGQDIGELMLKFGQLAEDEATQGEALLQGIGIVDLVLFQKGVKGRSAGDRIASAASRFSGSAYSTYKGLTKAVRTRNQVAHPAKSHVVPSERIAQMVQNVDAAISHLTQMG